MQFLLLALALLNSNVIVQLVLSQNTLALIDLLSRVDSMEEKEVYKEYSEISPFNTVDITAQDVAKIAVLEDFKSYVQDEANSIGQTNAQTKAKFEKLGLNYDKWVNFAETDSVEFNGHNFDIKLCYKALFYNKHILFKLF